MSAFAPEDVEQSYRECRVISLPGAPGTAGLAYPFPGVDYFSIRSVAFVVTTSGGGGARQVVVQLQDASGVAVFSNAAPATQASGLTVAYSFAPNITAFGAGALGFMGAAFVGGPIAANLTLVVQVVSAGAPDTIFNARVLVEKWPRVHPDYQR